MVCQLFMLALLMHLKYCQISFGSTKLLNLILQPIRLVQETEVLFWHRLTRVVLEKGRIMVVVVEQQYVSSCCFVYACLYVQLLFCVGVANLLGSFVSAYPVTASFSRQLFISILCLLFSLMVFQNRSKNSETTADLSTKLWSLCPQHLEKIKNYRVKADLVSRFWYWLFTKSCSILDGTTECFVIIYLPFSLNCKTRKDCCRSFFCRAFCVKTGMLGKVDSHVLLQICICHKGCSFPALVIWQLKKR